MRAYHVLATAKAARDAALVALISGRRGMDRLAPQDRVKVLEAIADDQEVVTEALTTHKKREDE